MAQSMFTFSTPTLKTTPLTLLLLQLFASVSLSFNNAELLFENESIPAPPSPTSPSDQSEPLPPNTATRTHIPSLKLQTESEPKVSEAEAEAQPQIVDLSQVLKSPTETPSESSSDPPSESPTDATSVPSTEQQAAPATLNQGAAVEEAQTEQAAEGGEEAARTEAEPPTEGVAQLNPVQLEQLQQAAAAQQQVPPTEAGAPPTEAGASPTEGTTPGADAPTPTSPPSGQYLDPFLMRFPLTVDNVAALDKGANLFRFIAIGLPIMLFAALAASFGYSYWKAQQNRIKVFGLPKTDLETGNAAMKMDSKSKIGNMKGAISAFPGKLTAGLSSMTSSIGAKFGSFTTTVKEKSKAFITGIKNLFTRKGNK